MKRCPRCQRVETDDTLAFCRADGTSLVRESGADSGGVGTLGFGPSLGIGEAETRTLPTDEPAGRPTATTIVLDTNRASGGTERLSRPQSRRVVILAAAALTAATFAASAYLYLSSDKSSSAIDSVAVLPFVNDGGDADAEYLSDGMTESLINSLAQLPNLSVKARSSVFRYKGTAVEPKQVASDLSVRAVLSGRVVQRGDDLTLYLSLVDARTNNQVWGERYDRKLADLVALQNEIARDAADKLRVKLSGADEQKLAKSYTANSEAYQLYLKGRYHLLKITRSETQRAVSYFQQAIDADPSYALAYAGLADAYRALAIAGEMPPTEFLPKAKAAAQKAVEIDDTLAQAHAVLGFITFWYDWNWGEAESHFKRALSLDPDSADAHIYYANLLSNLGRHDEALAKAKVATELDPLNLRTNALAGQFLLHAGRTDEALERLRKTLELDPNYWLGLFFLASAYIEKGMYPEAVAAARQAGEVYDSPRSISFLGFALAKSGKRAEAKAELERLLKVAKERYVSPYNVAMIYNGLGEREEALAWLEQGYQKRDPRLTFLKAEPKWDSLRSDPRFTDLVRKVGLPQ